MKIIKIDDTVVEYSEEGIYYSCHIKEHDLYFSSKIEQGLEMIKKKTNAMIQSKISFIKEFPKYK